MKKRWKLLGSKGMSRRLGETIMANCGIVHPFPGYHDEFRKLTKKYGAILIIDETHTICTGVGGYTKAYHLSPDMVVSKDPLLPVSLRPLMGLRKTLVKKWQRKSRMNCAISAE